MICPKCDDAYAVYVIAVATATEAAAVYDAVRDAHDRGEHEEAAR